MTLKQIIFLRNDLKKFSKGALIVQACHATTYAIFKFLKHHDTKKYLENINEMTKVILKINGNDIEEIKDNLKKNNIDFIEWIEFPENIITSLATRPFILDNFIILKKYLFKYKLF